MAYILKTWLTSRKHQVGNCLFVESTTALGLLQQVPPQPTNHVLSSSPIRNHEEMS
jgi:hypothetical protein